MGRRLDGLGSLSVGDIDMKLFAALALCVAACSGATILLDGGVSGGTESCQSLCGASQYEMTCRNVSGPPDSSLACQVIPIPTQPTSCFTAVPAPGEARRDRVSRQRGVVPFAPVPSGKCS